MASFAENAAFIGLLLSLLLPTVLCIMPVIVSYLKFFKARALAVLGNGALQTVSKFPFEVSLGF